MAAGAVLEGGFHGLGQVGVRAWLTAVCGAAIPRARLPVVPDVLRDGLKTLWGLERRAALPAGWFREAALRPWVGCKAPPVRLGRC